MRENKLKTDMAGDDKKYVFISYSHLDKELVDRDVAELKRHNIPVWIDDKLAPGYDWSKVALKRIKSQSCVGAIVYISNNSIVSRQVEKEVRIISKRFGKLKILDKEYSDTAQVFFSVNIGGKSPKEIRSSAKSEHHRLNLRRTFLRVFNNKIIYIPRSVRADDLSHIGAVLDTLELYDVAKPGVGDEIEYERINGGIRLRKYIGTAAEVVLPDNIEGAPVTEIEQNMFTGNVTITSIYVPDSVRRIGAGAFSYTPALKHIRLPETLDSLGEAAFRHTTALESVTFPKGISFMEQAMFKESGITSIVIPDDVEELGEAVFAGCHSLREAFIPDSVRKMTEGGFAGCPNLERLTIPERLEGLDDRSFSSCPKVDVYVNGLHYHDGISEKI